MERVGDLDGVGEHRVEHRLVGRRQIQRRPARSRPATARVGRRARRTAPPRHGRRRRRGAGRGARRRSGSTTAAVGTGRHGRTGSRPTRARSRCRSGPGHRSTAARTATTASITVCQSELKSCSDLGDRAAVTADLQRRPPRRPGRQPAARRRDPRILLGPRPPTRRATPSLLAPHQPGRPTEHRQIDQHDLADTVTMRRPFTARRPLTVGRDHDAQPLRPLADTDHAHVGQADQQRAHARSIRFQAGAPRDSTTSDIAENRRAPVPRPGPLTRPSSHPQIRSAGYRAGFRTAPTWHVPSAGADRDSYPYPSCLVSCRWLRS